MAIETNVPSTPNGERSDQPNTDTSPASPLYMHPSDNPGAMLVPVAFNGVGYRSWRRGVMRSLSVKNKLGFINGEVKKPDLGSPTFRQWERCDDMVTLWILNSLAKEIADSVEYVSSSAELWTELEDRYDQTNGAKLYQIQREINDLSQGAMDITTYYTKMKKLWEELSTLHEQTQCRCNCTCGAKENSQKVEQDRRLIQFLMGMNEVYTAIRGNILMMNPLPSLAQAFSLLIQEEKQREIKPNIQSFAESVALSASSSSSYNGRGNFLTTYSARSSHNGNLANSSYGGGSNHNSRGNYNGNGNHYSHTGNNRNRPTCDYCKKVGHTKDKCYKLHGYPQNQPSYSQNHQQYSSQNRFDKGKRVMASVQGPGTNYDVYSTRGAEQSTQYGDPNMNLTKEQYDQVISLLQHFQVQGEHMRDNPNSASASGPTNGTVNFAGIIFCNSSIDFGNLSCKCLHNRPNSWILDSGESNHMTFNISLLTNIITLLQPLLVILPNGYRVKVTQIGSVTLAPDIVWHKVFFVPSFKYNLISIHSLTSHSDSIVAFSNYSCLLQAPSMKRPQEIGRARDGIYLLCPAMLTILDSRVNKAGRLKALYVKTKKGVLFEVKPHVCIPRTFKRFTGIMLQLLQKLSITAVGKREKLLRVIKSPVSQYLPVDCRKIGFSHNSEKLLDIQDYVNGISNDMKLVFVVGAMAHEKIDKDYAED